MVLKAVPHEQAEQRFVGTPRPLPRVLFCHVPGFCGRTWIANTMPEYEQQVRSRAAHEVFCGTRMLDLP